MRPTSFLSLELINTRPVRSGPGSPSPGVSNSLDQGRRNIRTRKIIKSRVAERSMLGGKELLAY